MNGRVHAEKKPRRENMSTALPGPDGGLRQDIALFHQFHRLARVFRVVEAGSVCKGNDACRIRFTDDLHLSTRRRFIYTARLNGGGFDGCGLALSSATSPSLSISSS